jgi:hypothetical protein
MSDYRHSKKEWDGVRQASRVTGYATGTIIKMALDGRVRTVVLPDTGRRLYNIADLESLANQRRELLANA